MNIQLEFAVKCIILLVISIIAAIITIVLSECKFTNKIFDFINNKSIHDDIWQDIIDYREGTNLRIVCDDIEYIGALFAHEEKGLDSWFVLQDYIVTSETKSYNLKNSIDKTKLVINLRDVKYIEVYLEPDKNKKNNITK